MGLPHDSEKWRSRPRQGRFDVPGGRLESCASRAVQGGLGVAAHGGTVCRLRLRIRVQSYPTQELGMKSRKEV